MPVFASHDVIDANGRRRPEPAPMRGVPTTQRSPGHGVAHSRASSDATSYSASPYNKHASQGLYAPVQRASRPNPAAQPAHESPKPAQQKVSEDEVDALTNLLMQNMEAASDPDFFGQSCIYFQVVSKKIVFILFITASNINSCYERYLIYFKHFVMVFQHSGHCQLCGRVVKGSKQALYALETVFHVWCFNCFTCGKARSYSVPTGTYTYM